MWSDEVGDGIGDAERFCACKVKVCRTCGRRENNRRKLSQEISG